jgi:hypothetical protein
MTLATDHSTGGAIIGGSLRKSGLSGGILRYASVGRGNVNISPAEVRDLQANGIPIGIVCEHESDWILRAGVAARVNGSRQITRACGLPDGVIYLAADLDITEGGPTRPGSAGDRNMQRALTSIEQAAGVVGKDNVGFYGSFFGIAWLVNRAPWLRWYWQTEAWSMRQRHSHACLFQRAQSAHVHGVSVDIDEIWKAAWGARGQKILPPHPKPAPAPHPAPPPAPVRHASGHFRATLDYDHGRNHVELTPVQGEGVEWGDVP